MCVGSMSLEIINQWSKETQKLVDETHAKLIRKEMKGMFGNSF